MQVNENDFINQYYEPESFAQRSNGKKLKHIILDLTSSTWPVAFSLFILFMTFIPHWMDYSCGLVLSAISLHEQARAGPECGRCQGGKYQCSWQLADAGVGRFEWKNNTLEEVWEAVNEMKSGIKAPELDGFPVECLKKGDMAVLYNG